MNRFSRSIDITDYTSQHKKNPLLPDICNNEKIIIVKLANRITKNYWYSNYRRPY